jgi:GMP synthase-like glutamine amidotransferase
VSSCLVVQHIEPEESFEIGAALLRAGVTVETCNVFADEVLPSDTSAFDGLVVMGGPMSATSDEGFPTRAAEVALLADALERSRPILCVCLGAQLLARAAGGRVTQGMAGQEIGWGTVELTRAAASDPLLGGLPTSLTVLHWHGDTFELPSGATHLASNQRYVNQAYRVGERAWGFQFHIEVDDQAVGSFLKAFGDEAKSAGTDPETLAEETPACLEELAPARDQIVDRFARLVASEGERDRDVVMEEIG